MDDILASIRGHINERLNSPLFGAYALAWLFFNFKVPLMLFSGLDVHQKMYQIDMYLHADFDRVLYVYGWPLVIAAFYIFILPIPSTLVTAWTLLHQNVLARVQQKVLQRRIVTAEDVAEKEEKWRAAQDSREKRLQELEMTNEGLRSHRARLDSELNEAMVQLKNAVEMGKTIPALNQKISESSDQIIAMTSEVADLKSKIQSQMIEVELTKSILVNLANSVEQAGLGEHVYNYLTNAAASHAKIPDVIDGFISYLAKLNAENRNSGRGPLHVIDIRDPSLNNFGFGVSKELHIKDYLSDAQIFAFISAYRDWMGSSIQLGDSSIGRFKVFMDVLSPSRAAELYRLVNTASPDFDSMPDELKKGLRDIVEV